MQQILLNDVFPLFIHNSWLQVISSSALYCFVCSKIHVDKCMELFLTCQIKNMKRRLLEKVTESGLVFAVVII